MKAPKKGAGRDLSREGDRPKAANQAADEIRQNTKAIGPSVSGRNPIRILVVDDHPIVRRGLRSCLANYERLLIVGEAGNGKEAIDKTHQLSPDVVLMDMDLPKLDGLTATEVLVRENPASKVLILCLHKETPYALRILRVGAQGYISKEASPSELVQAIETVAAGKKFFGSSSAEVRSEQRKDTISGTGLSPREREVLGAIAEGLGNKEIAVRLGVGVRTIETHRERIIRKLKIHSTAGLTKFAISEGLISLPRDEQGGASAMDDG